MKTKEKRYVFKSFTNYYEIVLDDIDLRATIQTGDYYKTQERIENITIHLGRAKLGYTNVDWLEQFKVLGIAIAEWLAENTNPPDRSLGSASTVIESKGSK